MKRSITLAAVVGVVAGSCFGQVSSDRPAPAPSSKPASATAVPDLCRGAIEPYHPGRQRARFFKAAGIDSELDAREFMTDARRAGGFVRKFDKWQVMLEYDRNANSTIDWFESEIYRLAFRQKVMTIFDVNKDGRLKGAERDAANQALAAGKFTVDSPEALAVLDQDQQDLLTEELIDQYDTDGDGELSVAERHEAIRLWREEWWQGVLQKYDTDADGQLSSEERLAASRAIAKEMDQKKQPEAEGPKTRRNAWGEWHKARRHWELRLFDADGSGELDDSERQAAMDFGRRVGRIVQVFRSRSMDTNDNGKVTDAERGAFQREWRLAVRRAVGGGPGATDSEGAQGRFARRVSKGMWRSAGSFALAFDANRNGLFSPSEIEAMLVEIRKHLADRYKTHDADGDGRVGAAEAVRLMESFAPGERVPKNWAPVSGGIVSG